jgi:hypothetical protein
MLAKTKDDVRKIYDQVDLIKRLSDRIIGIGPINIIGLDGILAWIPGVGTVYSLAASVYILFLGLRARVDTVTLIQAIIVLMIDSGISIFESVPVVGWLAGAAADTVFQGHLYAAHVIHKNIDKSLYIEDSARDSHANGRHKDNLAQLKSTKGKKRIVYLKA